MEDAIFIGFSPVHSFIGDAILLMWIFQVEYLLILSNVKVIVFPLNNMIQVSSTLQRKSQ